MEEVEEGEGERKRKSKDKMINIEGKKLINWLGEKRWSILNRSTKETRKGNGHSQWGKAIW